MDKLTSLLPKVEVMARDFIKKCQDKGIKVIITSAYRSPVEQDALYAQGRTKVGNVVTNAKGGQSFHNWKVALDFAPVVNGVIPWNDKALFAKIGEIGESCGFEWGGRWASFIDLPHLQYTAGYSLEDFQKGRVDYSRFEIKNKLPEHVTKFLQASKDFQIAEGILDFANENNLAKIRIGTKTLSKLKKYYK